jgi:hypothetical protein
MNTIAHITNEATNQLNAVEAQSSGVLSRQSRLQDVAKKHRTEVPQKPNVLAKNVPFPQKNQVDNKPAVAAEQVDEVERSNAAALRGLSQQKRVARDLEENEYYLNVGTPSNKKEYQDLVVRSVLDLILKKEGPKSLVDTNMIRQKFNEDHAFEIAFKKLTAIEIALEKRSEYVLSSDEQSRLEKVADQIYDVYGEQIEARRTLLENNPELQAITKLSTAQLAKTYRMPTHGKTVGPGDAANIMKTLNCGPNKDVLAVLISLKQHWINVSVRDKTQMPADVTTIRQYQILSAINQYDQIIQAYKGLQTIEQLCVRDAARSGRMDTAAAAA